MPEKTWDDAIRKVLRTADGPLHYTDIAERIAAEGLYQVGPNPAASVNAILSGSLKDPKKSPYQKLGRGEYALKEQLNKQTQERPVAQVDETATAGLGAFGMYWKRESVNWESTTPALWGIQNPGASQVNFADQIGVYLLHDRDRVIYVGRAMDNILGSRLRAHINDRLGGRWDRFSWFGLKSVNEHGHLVEAKIPWGQPIVIETFEALLIESLEPLLNRRRGDKFSAVEFLQADDPEIKQGKQRKLLEEIMRTMRS